MEVREVAFLGNIRDWQWLDARLCTTVMRAQTFSFLSTCLMYLVDKKRTHCHVSGLERASPMVRSAENLVGFLHFFSLPFTFFSTLEHSATKTFRTSFTLSVPSWTLWLFVVWCCSMSAAHKCLVSQ